MLYSFFKKLFYICKGYKIGKKVTFERGSALCGKNVTVGNHVHFGKNVRISGYNIDIGDNSLFFNNVRIFAKTNLKMGYRCKISRNTCIKAYEINIGNELWCNEGVDIGGGGWQKNTARLVVGNNVHIGKNAIINVCAPVTIGDQTGVGIEVMIFTHSAGNGQSVFKGYTHDEREVVIGKNVSLFSRSFVSPGTHIADGVILGAHAFARGHLESESLYAGIPARKIKDARNREPVSYEEKTMEIIRNEFGDSVAVYSNINIPEHKEGVDGVVLILADAREINDAHLQKINESFRNVVFVTREKIVGFKGITNIVLGDRNVITGRTTRFSEAIRDAFRRYGTFLECDGYVPYLLDYKDLLHRGIELE